MKIACLLDSMFEDSEFKKPAEAFRQAGHQVTVIGLERGKELKGYRGSVTASAEKSIDEVRPDDYDALFIPGGAPVRSGAETVIGAVGISGRSAEDDQSLADRIATA